MVQILIFDTETNGLPKDKTKQGILERDNWPDLVSICWMLYEDETLVKTAYHVIKPQGWDTGPVHVHGITQEIAEAHGEPMDQILAAFQTDITNSKYVVAHNLIFDKNVIFNAFKWRLDIDPTSFWTYDKDFCTACKSMTRGQKSGFPKLDALYTSIFNKPAPPGAHNALRDVEVLRDVFFTKFWPQIKGKVGSARTRRDKKKRLRQRKSVRIY
jgi:DNA polymerase-3 subunit alpha